MLLAFDDTDSPDGGCTTRVLLDVLAALDGLVPRGLPRLVRLNPNNPHKTRGNAAVCVPLGVAPSDGAAAGPRVRAGEWRGQELRVHPDAPPAAANDATIEKARAAIQRVAEPSATPAVAVAAGPLPGWYYTECVRQQVDPAAAMAVLESEGVLWRAVGRQALVGCLGALAWPGPPSSYEFIAYREPKACGTPRRIDPTPLRGLDASGATFHTWDATLDRPACVPRTPDPVLCGLRGRDPDTLAVVAGAAIARAALERVDAWVMWATNQASGDHVSDVRSVLDVPDLGTAGVDASVAGLPETRPGGHAVVLLEDGTGVRFEAVAFEPTHGFRDAVRGLRPGDRVHAVGAWGPQGLRLEKLRVDHLVTSVRKAANPRCAACGRSMQSRGAGAGYRCRACGAKAGPDAAVREEEPRTVALGWHEVPVMARRHLHRPAAWL